MPNGRHVNNTPNKFLLIALYSSVKVITFYDDYAKIIKA